MENGLNFGHKAGHRSTAPPLAAQDSVKKNDRGAHLRADFAPGHYIAGART